MPTPEEKIIAAVAEAATRQMDIIEWRSGAVSPIERLLVRALTAACLVERLYPTFSETANYSSDNVVRILPQHPCGRYRLDFLIRMDAYPKVSAAIECDGHDFHDRTKEQAAYERARDRFVQSKGHLILRYTGSEIYRDPFGVASGILDHLMVSAAQLDNKGAD